MAFYSKLVECFTMSEEKEDYAFDEKKLADLLNELQRNIKLEEPDNIQSLYECIQTNIDLPTEAIYKLYLKSNKTED